MLETSRDLTPAEYRLFRDLVYEHSGIELGARKMQLVRSRLARRVRAGGFASFGEYYRYVRADASGGELTRLIDAISTNTTHLFREARHFEFLRDRLREWTAPQATPRSTTIRIWSAACSSGEEPYSIAITAAEALGERNAHTVKILATDISTAMLERARGGVFRPDRIGATPPEIVAKYFSRSQRNERVEFTIRDDVRRMITFSQFNLMSAAFPFRNPFDVIFCRNVMMYFDHSTQEKLVRRFARHLRPGGYLLIGHAESLSGRSHPFKYVAPTTYQMPG
jgi:chemotaxis protein methyltransferase CheR